MSEQEQSAVHRTYAGIIRNEVTASWRQWTRFIIGAYATYAFVMDLVFWVHRYVYDIDVIGNPMVGIPTWKLAVDTILWAAVLYWLYQGGLQND